MLHRETASAHGMRPVEVTACGADRELDVEHLDAIGFSTSTFLPAASTHRARSRAF